MKRSCFAAFVVVVALAAPAAADEPQSTTATYGTWQLRCRISTIAGKPTKSCEIAQTIQIKGQAQPLVQIAIGPQKAAAVPLTSGPAHADRRLAAGGSGHRAGRQEPTGTHHLQAMSAVGVFLRRTVHRRAEGALRFQGRRTGLHHLPSGRGQGRQDPDFVPGIFRRGRRTVGGNQAPIAASASAPQPSVRLASR